MQAKNANLKNSEEANFHARAAVRPIHIAANQAGADASELSQRAQRVAAIAAAHAAAVDCEQRFPREAVDAMRAERLLGIAVPHEFGGEDVSTADIIDICYTLGRACASAAMIYAMHQAAAACLIRHGKVSAWHAQLLRRLSVEQLLLASSTTEGQAGGDVRNSAAPITQEGGRVTLDRQATVISYGAAADGILTTARRSPDAASNDQVLVVFLKDDYALERIVGWDAFGMRGTCSDGFRLKASASVEQILPASYDKIHAQTMVPVAHLAWSAVWAGIAAAASDRARAFVRRAVHRPGGAMPPAAQHLPRAQASLRALRSVIAGALQRFETAADDPAALESVDFQTGMNLLKVNASELAVATVMSAMQACGLSGYRNDSEFSIGRFLRDILSSPIMISNDRILAGIASAALLSGAPRSLRD